MLDLSITTGLSNGMLAFVVNFRYSGSKAQRFDDGFFLFSLTVVIKQREELKSSDVQADFARLLARGI